eukprot:scaffold615_cov125-Isochrysis_galbana.AAC.2
MGKGSESRRVFRPGCPAEPPLASSVSIKIFLIFVSLPSRVCSLQHDAGGAQGGSRCAGAAARARAGSQEQQ